MKLISFRQNSQNRWGWIADDGATVITPLLQNNTQPASLDEVVSQGRGSLDQICMESEVEPIALTDLELLTPLARGAIFGAAVNYYPNDEKNESDRKGDYPVMFLRLHRNHVAHNQPLWVPRKTNTLDWEGELAAIIGTGGRHIQAENALEHVFGYSIYNEGTVRGYSKHSGQVGLTKNVQASGSFGPLIVTSDEFGNPYDHRITTTVDGEIMQDDSVDLMIHRIEDLIAYISEGTELQPGDIICTGTPKGMGVTMSPPRYLQSGEIIEVRIDGIGTLSNPVIDEP